MTVWCCTTGDAQTWSRSHASVPAQRCPLRAIALVVAFVGACSAGRDATTATSSITLVTSVTDISFDAIGATQSITATVRDQNGAVVAAVTPVFTSASTAIATVSGGTVTAVGNGRTTIKVSAGNATASIPVTVSQVAVAPVKIAGDAQTALVGRTLGTAIMVKVQDRLGVVIGGRSVAFTVAGGSVNPTSATTGIDGTAQTLWTLGTVAGVQLMNVTSAGVSEVATFSATAMPGPAAAIAIAGGDGQTALAGSTLANPLATAVKDQYGNNVPNVMVTYTVTVGGGSITPGVVSTGGSGVATGAWWTLGNKGGAQSVSATADGLTIVFTANIQSSYPLTLRLFGKPMSLAVQGAFADAADRLRAAIVSPVQTVSLGGFDLAGCRMSGLTGVLSETTAGVIVYASVGPIDGAGKVLAQSGPCVIRTSSALPAVGVMQFDEADIEQYISDGRFKPLVLHEMNHALGLGTVWEDRGLLINPALNASGAATGSTDPRYSGAAGAANCIALGGAGTACTMATGVAVEATGGAGTADGHWRKSQFGNEVMTGFIAQTSDMPWSAMSVGSFQDLGYTVNLGAADTYRVPSLLALARVRAAVEQDTAREVLRRPVYGVTAGGQVHPIVRTAR